MSTRAINWIVLALALGSVSGAHGDSDTWRQWRESVDIDIPAAANEPARGGGSLTVHATLADFQAATSGHAVTLEDFENINRPGPSMGPCDEPLNHETGQPGTAFIQSCFLPDGVVPGFSVRSDVAQGFALFAFGTGQFGIPTSFVGNTPGGASVLVNLHDAPTSVAMDIYDWNTGGEVQIEVFDLDDNLIDSFSVSPPNPVTPVFAGFSSNRAIKRVDISGATPAGGLGMDNLRFGGGPGVLDIDVGAAVAAAASGGGRLAVGADGESLLLDFGQVSVDSQIVLPVVVGNIGHLPLQVDSLAAPGAPFSVASDDCSGATLEPDATCTVEYAFTPAYTDDFTTEVVYGSDVAGAPDRAVTLTGRGVQPVLDVGPDIIDFGDTPIGTVAAPRSLSLVNASAGTVTVSSVQQAGGAFQSTAGSCDTPPFDLGPGETCALAFNFAPDESGDYLQSIQVASNSPDSPFVVELAGTGTLGGPDGIFPVPALGLAGQLLLVVLVLAGLLCMRPWHGRAD